MKSIVKTISAALCYLFLMGVLTGWAQPADQSDFSSDRLHDYFEQWQNDQQARIIETEQVDRNVLGKTYRRVYQTKSGKQELLLYKTSEDQLFDAGLMIMERTDDIADKERHVLQVVERLLWAFQLGEQDYLRSVISSDAIQVKFSDIGDNEEQLSAFLDFAGSRPVFESIELIPDDAAMTARLSVKNRPERTIDFKITPSLHLLVNGELALYRQQLIEEIRRIKDTDPTPVDDDSIAYPDYLSNIYALDINPLSFSFTLPEIERYPNSFTFQREHETDDWKLSNPLNLAPDSLVITKIQHFWATRMLPQPLQFPSIQLADNFEVNLVLEEKQLRRFSAESPFILDVIPAVMGKGLPAYYAVSKTERTKERIEVQGMWKVLNPALQIEHAFRVTDTIQKNGRGIWVWKKSRIRGVLAVRMDNIQNLYHEPNRANSLGTQKFKIKMN